MRHINVKKSVDTGVVKSWFVAAALDLLTLMLLVVAAWLSLM